MEPSSQSKKDDQFKVSLKLPSLPPPPSHTELPSLTLAHAYLQSTTFTSYTVNPPILPASPPPPASSLELEERGPPAAASFEISLPALLECLNIFGNAAPIAVENAWVSKRRRMRDNEEGEEHDDVDRQRAKRVGGGGEVSKVTAARFSYAGVGFPLLIL